MGLHTGNMLMLVFFGEVCHDTHNFEGILELQRVLGRVLLKEQVHFSHLELLSDIFFPLLSNADGIVMI